MIAIVGAGGKTTTMFYLADKYANAGKNVIVTTSTHIGIPQEKYVYIIEEEESASNVRDTIRRHFLSFPSSFLVIAAREGQHTHKLCSPKEEYFAIFEEEADMVIVEADGSRQLPLKVPREHEPKILQGTTEIVIVAGMDAIGQKAREICFAYEHAVGLYGWDEEHCITKEDIVRILTDSRAGLKYATDLKKTFVLNKADTIERMENATYIKERILAILQEGDMQVCICSRQNRDINLG